VGVAEALLAACASGRASTRPPPAVVIVSIDTLRPDHLGCYGYAKPTSPRIDGFRREAVLLRRVVAAAPSTLASHAAMFTSLGTQHHGASVAAGSALYPGVTTLAERLRLAGFATASFNGGGQLHRSWGLDRGFDSYESATDSSSAEIGEDTLAGQVERARPWLESVAARPFFLFLHTYEVHHPYTPSPERLQAMEESYAGTLPPTISIRLLEKINSGQHVLRPGDLAHIVATYDAEIASADEGFGTLLALLRRLGRYDSSIVVLTSDHGEAFGERGRVGWHGDSLYDEQIRVPLIVRMPGGRLAGRTLEAQVRLIDLAPSLLSLLGLPVPSQFSGAAIDFAGGAAGHPPWAVSSLDGQSSSAAVRTERWKWYEGHLYDLARDPGETRDVAASHRETERRLAVRLAAILGSRETPTPTRVRTSTEVQEQLKALGYVH
jgi:arylsulfatase A-like enzyme